jgi:hypothetical protein
MRLGVQQLDDLTCPACSEGGAAYHIDSNMKLFVWSRNREPWRERHLREFFAADANVQLTLKATDAARVSSGVSGARSCRAAYTVALVVDMATHCGMRPWHRDLYCCVIAASCISPLY